MRVRACAVILVLGALTLAGCGGRSARVKGRVTCQGKAVPGSILFSPKGESPDNSGPAVPVPLAPDGSYQLQLKSIGPHRVVVSPSDIVYPARPGEEYPCDLSPQERDVKAGDNEIVIDLPGRGR